MKLSKAMQVGGGRCYVPAFHFHYFYFIFLFFSTSSVRGFGEAGHSEFAPQGGVSGGKNPTFKSPEANHLHLLCPPIFLSLMMIVKR